MEHLWFSAISYVVFSGIGQCQGTNLNFPENFAVGASTSAYQVEGAWNKSGKGVSIWDWYTHNYPERIADGSNGDIACDSYHKYLEDVQWLKKLGMDHYRFSISWSRVLPNGLANNISRDGIQYYKNLIEALVTNGIQPLVTIYHNDHPQVLEDMGGWTNELMVGWYAAYARVIFEEFGPMVKTFITINEPSLYCLYGYNGTGVAPGKVLENMGQYLCVHNMLKAHATAYHMYHDEYRPTQKGQIGIDTNCMGWVSGKHTTDESIKQFFQFDCGWIMHPIYIGDYPQIMKTRIASISKLEGHSFSRLPEFSEKWIKYINGTADFFGLNHYTSTMPVFDPDEKFGKHISDSGIVSVTNGSWPTTASSLIQVVPTGFGNLLRMIKDEYNNPPLYITENGYPDTGELADYNRISYHYEYISELLTAIKQDGCNVQKYTIWALIDTYEWTSSFTVRFGIISVNSTSPNRERRAKLSTTWWQKVIRTRTLQDVPVTDSVQ